MKISFSSDKKILITGANGFVGLALCDELRQKNFNVCAIVRTAQKQKDFLKGFPTFECCVRANFLDCDWSFLLNNVDTIIHLASRVHVMDEQTKNPLAEYRKMNVEITRNLASAAIKKGVRRFIYLSSVKVNGEVTLDNQKFSEFDIPNYQDFYGQSKWEAEQVLHDIFARSDSELVIIRPPLVYGKGVKANFQKLIQIVQQGWPLPLGIVNNSRSLIYVRNLADAIIKCIDNENAKGQTYLVSDNDDVSTPELIRRLASVLKKPARLIFIKPSWLEFMGKIIGKQAAAQRVIGSLVIDSGKIRNELNWNPPYTMEQAFQKDFGNTTAQESGLD